MEVISNILNNANAGAANGEECSICYELLSGNSNRCTTSCGHTYCMTCFIKSTQQNNVCPLCRSELYPSSMEDDNDEDVSDFETLSDEDDAAETETILSDQEVIEEDELVAARRLIEHELNTCEVSLKTEDIAERLISAGLSFHDLVCYTFSGVHSKTATRGFPKRQNLNNKIDRILDDLDDILMETNQMMKEEKQSRMVVAVAAEAAAAREVVAVVETTVVGSDVAIAPVHILVPRRKG